MPEANLNEEQIRTKIKEYCDNSTRCGLEAFLVKKDSPKLRRISFSEEVNEQGKNFERYLKRCFWKFFRKNF